MIKIRLARGGRKNVPFYRFVATNSTSPRDSKFLEKLGTYNPLANDSDEKKIVINKDRIEHWLSVGAQPTERVAKFLIALGVKGAAKYKPEFTPKKKGDNLKKKGLEKLKLANEAAEAASAKAAEEAAAAAAPAPAAAAEAAAEETAAA